MMSVGELIDLWSAEGDRANLLDLSGGQPEIVPEWILWTMRELLARNLDKGVYLWSDDNLSTDYFDLLPCFRTKLSMICAKERGRRYVEEQAHRSADDRGTEAGRGGRKVEDVAREVGVSKHTLYAWKAKYGGMDVSQAQEAKQLRDENTKLRKLVADLSLDKEALQSVIRKNGWSS